MTLAVFGPDGNVSFHNAVLDGETLRDGVPFWTFTNPSIQNTNTSAIYVKKSLCSYHTYEAYRQLYEDRFDEALRDRTIDIPNHLGNLDGFIPKNDYLIYHGFALRLEIVEPSISTAVGVTVPNHTIEQYGDDF